MTAKRKKTFRLEKWDKPLSYLPETLQQALREEENWIFRSAMHWWFIWNTEQEWVGYAGASEFAPKVLYIGPTMIVPKYRGLGGQNSLIRARELWAKKNKYSLLKTSTYAWNIVSNNNLIKNGFKLVEPWNLRDRGNLYWEKKL